VRWEYCTIDLNDLPRKADDLDLLNDVGDDGWELVAITVNRIAFLKRQIDDAKSTGTIRRVTKSSSANRTLSRT
jgi:hypothetical protein